MVVAAATDPGTPASATARAPRTQPPIWDTGRTSDPASRIKRPHIKTQTRVPGTSTRQATPSSEITPRWITHIAEKPAQPIARSDRITAAVPKYPTSAPIIAKPKIAAMIGMAFMSLVPVEAKAGPGNAEGTRFTAPVLALLRKAVPAS